jgi:hypothetical protein
MKHFISYATVVLLPFLYSINYYNITFIDCLGIPGGLLIWIVAEYCFHRFAFHNNNLSPRTYELLAYNHANHHDHPENTANLFLPLRLTMPIALVLFFTACVIFGVALATFLLLGMFIGLSFYEFVHYQAHNKFYKFWPFNYLTRRHLAHHYETENRKFGVTSPIMDWIMGTK